MQTCRVSDDDSELYTLLYAQLKRMASVIIRRERPGHTLTSTALLNEAYLKLASGSQRKYKDHDHFLSVAGRVMRQVLVDYARARLSEKRGDGAHRLNIDDLPLMADQRPEWLISLDDALDRLAQFAPRQASIVDMKYFGGRTDEEVAGTLGLSVRTVIRDRQLALAWLYGETKAS